MIRTTAFEVPSLSPSKGDKYVLYKELAGLWRRMNDASVLMLYQHLPRVKRDVYFERQGSEMRERLGLADLAAVTDNEIAFFIAAKSAERAPEVRELTQRYAARTGLAFPL